MTAHELGPVCHLFCHWVCYVHYRLVCRWICGPLSDKRPDLRLELQMAGEALRGLLEHRRSFDEAVAASNAGDAEKLGAAIRDAGSPSLLLHLRMVLQLALRTRVHHACRHLPSPVIRQLRRMHEAFVFAQAVGQLGAESAASCN